jgi:hypothetical protein
VPTGWWAGSRRLHSTRLLGFDYDPYRIVEAAHDKTVL